MLFEGIINYKVMIKPSISALIIAKNEELMIGNCIKSLEWCDEIIVVDDGSVDETREIAESYGAKVISFKHSSFSRLREEALKRATSEWIIYIDADVRRARTMRLILMVLIPIVIIVVMALFHFFVKPLDVFWYVTLRRVGI